MTAQPGARFADLDLRDYTLDEEWTLSLPSPALLVFLDAVRTNLSGMQAMLGGALDRWRPHVKTAKIPEVFAEYLRLGVRQFKCATTREAQHLLEACDRAGVEGVDLLVAYPHVEPALRRLRDLAGRHDRQRLSVLCEDPDRLPGWGDILGVFVDLNPGMHRTGVPLDQLDRALEVARLAGQRLRGIHFYEGHLHDPDLRRREEDAFDLYRRLLESADRFEAAGCRVAEIITSGTPAFPHALAFPDWDRTDARHRISPGTVIYHDVRSAELLPQLDFLRPAAVVFSRVISHPRPGLFTLDAGSKSIAAEAGDPAVELLGRPGAIARTPSEEHLPVEDPAGSPARGSAFLLVPRHVCPTVNLAEEAVLLEQGAPPRVVSVAARAHDLRYSGGA